MDRKNRPLSREKNIVNGSAQVRRRGSGIGAGSGSGGNGPSGNGPSGGRRSSGGRGKSSLLRIAVLVVVLIILSRTGLLGSLFSGGDSSYSDDTPSSSSQGSTSGTSGSQQGQAGINQATLNTKVSADARAKRTVLKGDGEDIVTIMVYMCGTDLESKGGYATKDLVEMQKANISDQVNLLVFTGGCKQWQNNVISSSKNQIFQVKDGGMTKLWESSKLKAMTDPNTLAEFISWGKENYPADRFELIFWDHGGGSVSGYGYDEVHSGTGSMTLDGIATALKKGDCIFDFVGFDACLMATLETALVVEPYADYLIASEETEPGCGWYYTDWLSSLSEDTSLPTLKVGKYIADDFVSVCGNVAPRQQATLSVIDLAELAGTVPESFRNFAQSTADSIRADNYQSVATARSRTKEFAASSNIDQVDLIHLADNLDTAESRQLVSVLKSAVKYNATSNNIQNANGVSIYFPYGRTNKVNKMAETYEKIGLDKSYTDCIKSFASVEVAGQAVSGGSTGQMDSLFGALLSGGQGYSTSSSSASVDMIGQLLEGLLQASDRSLEEVGLDESQAGFLDSSVLEEKELYLAKHRFDTSALVWTEKDGNQVLILPEDQWDLVQDVELNVFVDDGGGYIDLGLDNVFSFNDDGDLIGDFDQTWLALNEHIVAYYMLSNEGTPDDYKIMGRIPAFLNDQRVNLIVSFTNEHPKGEVLGASLCYDEDTETETIARGLLEIQEGDRIDFLCNYYDYDRNLEDTYYLGDPLTVSGKLKLGNILVKNSSYIAAYRITDIYHNYYWTPAVVDLSGND